MSSHDLFFHPHTFSRSLTVLYFACWAFWRYYMIHLPVMMDEQKITASDFAVIVEPLEEADGWERYTDLQKDLRTYAQHWGPVAVATPMINLGGYVEFCERKALLLRKKGELEARIRLGDSLVSSPASYLFKLMFGGGLLAKKGLGVVETKLKELDAELEAFGKEHKITTLGSGLIIFGDLEAANRFIAEHNPNPAIDLLARIPVWGHRAIKKLGILPVFESGGFTTVFRARTAPEPADVRWGSAASKYSRFKAAVISSSVDLAAILILLCAAGWQFGLERVKRQELLRKADAELIYVSENIICLHSYICWTYVA